MYISVSLVGNKEIKALNKKHLGRDYATDVLSFNYSDNDDADGEFLGDIIVSTERAREQALEYGNTYEQEVADLVAHGVLHLLGVHHDDDNEVSTHGVKQSRGVKK
ncbi:rRNA maturation RNase YbeY [candidate division WWE3 bacterium CG08_land_8_20_14_0_20_41_10]|uniref:Endoribonuclease YbeY n=1 Tax=candidate division WWE3 bacterium CG08_land_8_20_14_0_20_41_10 TaxID=1975085 RepID=A0A2H0XF93_UNCKA|nr:MAG: rRNA maturation RNase YbeY [candidate division WWE3 bacterium CG08_land_8_20_14_0_20_41_10]